MKRELTWWIVSSDTLNYFGDLSPVFQFVWQALKPYGQLVFTLEEDGYAAVVAMFTGPSKFIIG